MKAICMSEFINSFSKELMKPSCTPSNTCFIKWEGSQVCCELQSPASHIWFPGKQLDMLQKKPAEEGGMMNMLHCQGSCMLHTKELEISKYTRRKILLLWIVFEQCVSASSLPFIFNTHHLSIMRHLLLKSWSTPAVYSSPQPTTAS